MKKKAVQKKIEKPAKLSFLIFRKQRSMFTKLMKHHKISLDEIVREAIEEKFSSDLNL